MAGVGQRVSFLEDTWLHDTGVHSWGQLRLSWRKKWGIDTANHIHYREKNGKIEACSQWVSMACAYEPNIYSRDG